MPAGTPASTVAGTVPDADELPAQPAGAIPAPQGGDRELRQLARGGALALFGVVAGGVFGFLLVVVVTRGYGARFTGVFFACVALYTILSTIGELGASTGLLRQLPVLRVAGRDRDLAPLLLVALRPVLALSALAALVLLVLAPQLGHLVSAQHPDEAARYLRLLAPFLLVGAASTVVLSAFRVLGSMRPYVLLENIAKPVVRPVGVLLALALGLGGTAVALIWALPVALGFVAAALLLARLLRRVVGDEHVSAGTRRQRRALSGEFWRFTAPRGLAAACAVVVTWSAVVLLGALRSAEEAGVYTAVSRLVLTGYFAIHALRLVLGPQISRLLAERRVGDAEQVYRAATGWLMLLSWPFYLTMAVFPRTYLSLFGHGFTDVGARGLVVLALVSLLDMATGNITLVLLMAGRSSLNLLNAGTALTTNVVLSLLLIPSHGITGAALAWGASIAVENVSALVQVARGIGIKPFGYGYLLTVLLTANCFGVLALAVRWQLGQSPGALAVALLVGVVPYAAGLYVFRGPLHLGDVTGMLRGRTAGRAARREVPA